MAPDLYHHSLELKQTITSPSTVQVARWNIPVHCYSKAEGVPQLCTLVAALSRRETSSWLFWMHAIALQSWTASTSWVPLLQDRPTQSRHDANLRESSRWVAGLTCDPACSQELVQFKQHVKQTLENRARDR